MPELPEMETYRTLLQPRLAGRTITAADIQREKSINVSPESFRRAVLSKTVIGISRRAKHLLFHLDSGQVLLLHLMLGGLMFCGTEEEKPNRTVQVTLSFGDLHLYFIGLRLGYLHLLNEGEAARKLASLGPEPLEPGFSEQTLGRLLRAKRSALKLALTDQKTIAGIGNCYSDEICFAAGILPFRKIDSLGESELRSLFGSMRSVLLEAIRYGGYMESPLFPGDRLTGGFDSRCRVYDRGGEPCVRCGTPIVQDEIASRKMFYCGQCQR